MSLNLKSSLEIVKRAGFGSDDRMTSSKSERRMADSQRNTEPWLAEEQADAIQAAEAEFLDEVFENIDLHSNPQNLNAEKLLDINDL